MDTTGFKLKSLDLKLSISTLQHCWAHVNCAHLTTLLRSVAAYQVLIISTSNMSQHITTGEPHTSNKLHMTVLLLH